MSTPLSLYPVNTASSVLLTAGLFVNASGSTTTNAPTTLVGTATGWGEIAFNGNAGPWAAAGAEPVPTGYGALFDASSSVLVAQMILAGNWTAALKLFNNGSGTTLSLDHLKVRFWKYTSASTTYTSIGSIDLGTQTLNTTATAFNFPSTSGSAMNFATGDYLYIDLVAHITSGTNTTTTTKIKMTLGGSNLTNGNASFNIVSPGFQPTPVLAVASSTLSFSATAGGANPASQGDVLSETSGTGTAWTSSIVYGSGSGWLAISPTSDTLAAGGTNETVTFSCTTGALAASTYSATVTFTATTGGNTVVVTVTFTVNPTSGTLVYSTSPYACTIYVSGRKTALDFERLQQFAAFTNGGAIPITIRYQYSANYVITAGTPSNPTYGGWGPLDETVDKVNGIPGLRLLVNLAYFPSNWLAIDNTGKNVGYGGAGAVLPDGPAMATFAVAISQRYGNRIDYQIGNEEYDTGLNGPIGGTILAQTCNYTIPVIRQNAPKSLIIAGAIRPLSHPTGVGTQQWMNNFYNYVPKAGEPKQSLPDAHDFHMYGDGSFVESNKTPSPDPTVTDNSANQLLAVRPNVQGIVSIMQGVLQNHNPNAGIMNLENGYNLPNCSPNNHNNNPSDIPSQQSRYTRTIMAQLQNAGASMYGFYTLLGSANDPRALSGLTITDYTSYVAAIPSWTGVAAPKQYLYTSVDTLAFEGTTSTKPVSQYFSIMNPTGTQQSWSISHDQSWLSAVTLPTNGMGGTGGGATSGNLATGQCITLKCTADSTLSGLSTLLILGGTLTVTIGGTDYPISVNLFVLPAAANPDLTSTLSGPNNGLVFSMATNASPPAPQGFSFKNADGFSTWWYAFTTGGWLTIDTASGTLDSLASQTINVSIGSAASSLAPGTYNEVVTVSATPFPATYSWDNPPAATQFISIQIRLTVQQAHSPTVALQLSTPTLAYTAVASGTLPAAQTFFLHNCTNHVEDWTVAAGSYAGGGSGWLTLSPASGSNLPANGSDNGAAGGVQATDYQVITASVNTTGLAAGTHTATITATLGTGGAAVTQTIAVTYVVTGSGSTQIIGATSSPSPFSLTQTVGGADVSGTVTLTNSGTQSGTYTSAITYTIGNGWIKSITPPNGPLSGGGGTQLVTITLQTGTRTAGRYTATVRFTLGSSTADVNITFTITAPVTGPSFSVSPTALPFNAVIGASNPAPQVLTVTNGGGTQGTWSATIAYNNAGNNQGWLTLSPLSGALDAGASQSVNAFADETNLLTGTYTATISIGNAGAGAGAASTQTQATVQVTFVVAPQPAAVGGALSNLLSLAVQKTQVVKVYDASGNYLGIWRDAPHLTGLRSTMNAADSQVKMTLPRKIDAFGGAGQPDTDNTVVMGNNVQVWLYGPGLPTGGLLKLNGVIDTIEPSIDASNAESVTITITPYGSVMADHGIGGSLTLTNVDPLQFFTYWFTNTDPITQLGGVTYADPLTLSSACATSSGLTVTYTILNQNIKSVLDAMMLMLGGNWFWRVNPDASALVSQMSPTAQHILILGQHISTLSGLQDNSVRKNVIRFVGSTGVSATAVSTSGSALPPRLGGIGERLAFYQDSRITDNGSAQVMANGILSLLDRPLTRMKCRLPDYRGDIKTGLGYDIESISVGDTVSIRDARQVGLPTVWGSFKWGSNKWGQAPGAVFNMIVPVLSIDYSYDYIDIEVGVYQPSLNRQLYQIRTKLQDFTTGFG